MFQKLLGWLLKDERRFAGFNESELVELDPLRVGMFMLLHLLCLLALYTGVSVFSALAMLFFYVTRMFFITAFYHRYFSHKTFRTGRFMQFMMAVLGCTAGQRGPLWWAAHHRMHHLSSDTPQDPHSPNHGLLHSHLLWFLRRGNFVTPEERVKDWARYPELRLLERLDWLPFMGLALLCYVTGDYIYHHYPMLNTNGAQLLVWGFFISTVLLYHGTYSINSLAHRLGTRRFNTRDDSRNNACLALLTLGEGWHNNHHRFPASARQGFYPGEIDVSYLGIRLLGLLGLAHDIRQVPEAVLIEGRRGGGS